MPAQNLEYQATWQAQILSITFNANGGDITEATKTNITYGSALPALTSTLPKKSGSIFKGYFDSNGKMYYDSKGQAVRSADFTTITNNSVTLTAQWGTAVNINITLDKATTQPLIVVISKDSSSWSALFNGSTTTLSLIGLTSGETYSISLYSPAGVNATITNDNITNNQFTATSGLTINLSINIGNNSNNWIII